MKVTCSSCGAEYQIDDRKIPATGAFVTCKTCSAKIKLAPPGKPASSPAPAIALPGSGASAKTAAASPAAKAAAPAAPAAIPLPGAAGAATSSPASTAIPLPGAAARAPAASGAIPLPASAPAAIPLPSSAGADDAALAGLSGAEVALAPAPRATATGGAMPLAGSTPSRTAGKPVPLPAAANRGGAVPLPGIGAARPTPPAASAAPAPAPAPARPPSVDLPAAAPIPGLDPGFDTAAGGGAMPYTDPDAGAPSLGPLDLAFGTPDAEGDPGADAAADGAAPAEDVAPGEGEPPAEPPAAAGAALDGLFDLPAAVTDDDLPAAGPTPGFLQDLPAADDGGAPAPSDADPFAAAGTTDPDLGGAPYDDLPGPEDDRGSLELDDRPRSAVAAPPVDDLPIGADVAPSLMDDLPIPAAGAPVGEGGPPLDDLSGGPAQGDPFAGAVGLATSDAVRLDPMAAAGPGPPLAEVKAKAPKEGGRRRVRAGLLVTLGVVAVAAVVLQLGPLLGVDLIGGAGPAPPPKPAGPPAAAKPASGAPATAAPARPAAPAPPAKPTPPVVETVALTAANVDALAYGTLKRSVEALAAQAPAEGEARDLVWWGWFRLAHTFGDEAAAEKLLTELPRKLDDPAIGAMGAAAGIGVLILDDKVPGARKMVERLRKGRHRDSPHLAYVAGLAFEGPGPKAGKLYERAAKDAPQMLDARIAAAVALLAGRNAGLGLEELRQLVGDGKDLDLRVRVVERLAAAEQWGEIEALLAPLTEVEQVEHVAPARRAETARLLARLRLRQGDIDGALAAAKRRADLLPNSVPAIAEVARFEHAVGRDAAETLATAYGRIEDETERSQVLAEQIHLALAKGDVPGATALLDGAADLPKKTTAGWVKLAEGWIAAHGGKVPRARAAYIAAAKGRPKFAEPRLAQILLEPGPPPQELTRLTQLSKLADLPAVDYHLAKVMQARGNVAGALELVEAVLWRDGLPGDPIDLLLGWIELLARAGRYDRAEDLGKKMQKARPKDQRPLRALIDMAEAQGNAAKAAEWWQQLVLQTPDNFTYKAALAAHLMSAGRDAEARSMLDDVQGNKEAMRNAMVLYRLGQAWAKREPIKARGFLIEARAIEPSAEVHLLLGQIDEARDKNDTAIEAYREALRLNPDLDLARRRLTRLLLAKGDLQEAELELRDLSARLPNDIEVAEMMGDCLRDMEKPKDAIKAYMRAAIGPEPPAALLLKIGKLQLQSLGQVGPSVRTLRRAVQTDPKAAEGFYLLGYALKDLGRMREAREALEQYLVVAPKDELADEVRADLRDLREQ